MLSNTGRTMDCFLGMCLRLMWLFSAIYNNDFRIQNIGGKDNILADALSYYQLYKVDKLGNGATKSWTEDWTARWIADA